MRDTDPNYPHVTLLFATVLCWGMVSVAAAQEVKTDYKLGDRVECDPNWGKYYKGTIVKVAREGWQYRIKFDYDGSSATLNMELPCMVKQMRPLQPTDPAATEPARKNPAPQDTSPRKDDRKPKGDGPVDFTYLADREPLDCPISQTQVGANARPDVELLKKVIRCLYERRAPAGITGAKTVDITAFQIGTSRAWRPLQDIGNGNLQTTVYPVKASWTEKTFHESFTQQIDIIGMFNCYVNAVGEWECGSTQRIKESDIKRTPR